MWSVLIFNHEIIISGHFSFNFKHLQTRPSKYGKTKRFYKPLKRTFLFERINFLKCFLWAIECDYSTQDLFVATSDGRINAFTFTTDFQVLYT